MSTATVARKAACPPSCKYQDLHNPRFKFNSGYWDGKTDVAHHRGIRSQGQGNPLPQDCSKNCSSHQGHHMHNTAYYRAGYRVGVDYARFGFNDGERSTEAWEAFNRMARDVQQRLFA